MPAIKPTMRVPMAVGRAIKGMPVGVEGVRMEY